MRAALERGEPQIGTWLTMVRNPSFLSLMKAAGLDFAGVDMEHTALTIETIADMAVLSRALNFPIAVRPPKANREWITRLLDVGVWNLHCPQVENAAHAREIVDASRYAPMGLRGNGGLSAATDFDGALSQTERRAHANREVYVTVMFETAKAFDDLDGIAAMPGIDALTIGPADLGQDPGGNRQAGGRACPGRTPRSHPECLPQARENRRDAGRQLRGDAALEGSRRAAVGIFLRRRCALSRLQRGDEADQGDIAFWRPGMKLGSGEPFPRQGRPPSPPHRRH
jgi:2-keto-3-deoxy-L-rhamnonate aldolase RhmA